MLAVVAPGQGAQTPGMLTPWLDLDGVTDQLRWWSAVTEVDLVRYGTSAEADEIRDTTITQPLVVACGMLGASALFPEPADCHRLTGAIAGHSLGELTAAAVAGVFPAEAALVLVRERARAMASAAAATEAGGMMAVLGGRTDDVLAKIAEHGLTPANRNSAGQVVVAGTLAQLASFEADPPRGVRLRPLEVAGAFHTDRMAPAVRHLTALVAGMGVRDPGTRYLSNADGAVVSDGTEVMRRLVTQISNPVRWDQCMQTLASLGVTAVIELPPGGTLTGLISRTLPDVETLPLRTPDDLDAARALIDRHLGAGTAPGSGTGTGAAGHNGDRAAGPPSTQPLPRLQPEAVTS